MEIAVYFLQIKQSTASSAPQIVVISEKCICDLSSPTAQSVFMRQGALWMLISYSIRDKTALNVLIYLQAPPDSLSFCVTYALSNTFAARRGGGSLLVVLSR